MLKTFEKLALRTKLIVAFTGVLICLAGVILFAISGFNELNTTTEEMYQKHLMGISYLSQINKLGQNTYENMTNQSNIQFDPISVLDSSVPTVSLFYSSKCSACNEFLPDYQMLREKYKDNPKYRIAIINCDDNPSLGITKFQIGRAHV